MSPTLTLGLEHASGWDASVSYTYRGQFFTDEANTVFDQEGENGLCPSVWLLSARGNYRIPGTGTTLFVAGDNLTDELYISDREDGVKPGQGRTFWGGAKIKLPVDPNKCSLHRSAVTALAPPGPRAVLF